MGYALTFNIKNKNKNTSYISHILSIRYKLLNEIMLIIIISINSICRSIILVGYLGPFIVKGAK